MQVYLKMQKTGLKSVEEFDSMMINNIDQKFLDSSQFYLNN